jgi:hypothetical protein
MMMRPRKTLDLIEAGSRNLRFGDVLRLSLAFGFELARISGSHHILRHSAVQELLSLQNVGGRAKPYQVRQLMDLVARYSLHLEDRR